MAVFREKLLDQYFTGCFVHSNFSILIGMSELKESSSPCLVLFLLLFIGWEAFRSASEMLIKRSCPILSFTAVEGMLM